jgi:hypothetical protein
MPQIPEATDWYIVVPFDEAPPETLLGAAQIFVVGTNDADIAAQVAFDNGFDRCIVIIGVMYVNPNPSEPKERSSP